MIRRWLFSIILAGLVFVAAAPASATARYQRERGLTVAGAVATPTTYTIGQLQALPQTTFTATRAWWWGGSRLNTDQGVSLESLVNAAQPTLPTAKNALLRVTVAVSSERGRSVTFALGELDPSFGDHAAYLALQQNGHQLWAPELVVPGDTNPARTLSAVNRITVAVHNPTPTIPPAAGAVTIQDGPHITVLSATQLGSLSARALTVTFEAGTATQQHIEVGPSLQDVLRAADIRTRLNTWVAAVGSDGYVATVTPAEAWAGGRPLLISLNEDGTALGQPRLVTDGDLKGGRYVSDIVDLVIGQNPSPGWPWHDYR